MTDVELGYFAGIVDGEGTIYWNKVGKAGGVPYLRVVNTDERLIEWCVARCGGTVHTRPEWGVLGKRPVFSWSLNAAQAAYVLTQLLPLLILKQDKAYEVITRYEAARETMARPGARRAADARVAEQMAGRGWPDLAAA